METEALEALATKCKEALLGTSDSVESWCEKNEVPEQYAEEIESRIGQHIERCSECEWWVECGELADEDGNEQPCENCR